MDIVELEETQPISLSDPRNDSQSSQVDNEQEQEQPRPSNRTATLLETVVSISVFAICGAWTRSQLNILQTTVPAFSGVPFLRNTYFLSNILGCFVMGMLTKYPQFVQSINHNPVLTSLIQTGIGTGYCGSLTTFSSWITSIALQFNNDQVAAGFNSLLTCFAAYLCSFELGCQTWMIIEPKLLVKSQLNSKLNDLLPRLYHDSWLGACLILCTVPVIVIMCIYWTPEKSDLLVVGCAPLGALLRWLFSRWFNPSAKSLLCRDCGSWLPWGTLLANFIGTLISASITAFVSSSESYVYMFNVFFSGSLSTVSTWIRELSHEHLHLCAEDQDDLNSRQLLEKHWYFLLSILVCLGPASLIISFQ
eukprot:TRINITY_DN19600_c0_g1_i1.p1 TRINITY_DN19600_c0_g1~~TRINITY_DN19600_c0_g1_i1.p1  ORF type:complete len:363 (+),score=60.98 TRINITY_DN19600_c0_g1_i1:61-1149(+)